jgi:hypothetical protein
MNSATKMLSSMALCCAFSAAATAQQQEASPPVPPAKATPQSEAGEPRADTSNPAPAAPATETPTSPSSAPPAGADRSRATPSASRSPADHATPAGASTPADHAAPGAGSGQKPGAKIDRLELGLATVTGDHEQPKVMYIVPWKKSDIGDLAGKPMNSLVDEILAPVDRDVFKREVVYYHAVQADTSQNGAPPKPAQQGEK